MGLADNWFKKTALGVQNLFDEVDKRQARLAQIHAERGRLTMLPATRPDFEAMFGHWVVKNGAAFSAHLASNLAPLVRDARGLENPRLIDAFVSLVGTNAAFSDPEFIRENVNRALCAAFPKEVLTALVGSLDLIDWPPNGMTLPERKQRLGELDIEELALQQELARLEAAADEAGVRRTNPVSN